MRIIRLFCKTVFYACFYKYLWALQLIAKPLSMGSPVQIKYAFMSRYGKVNFLYSIYMKCYI